MDPKMEKDHMEEMDIEVLSSAWPEDINDKGKQFKLANIGAEEDMFERLKLKDEPTSVDFNHLLELTTYSEIGSSQIANLIKHWEYKHANAVQLLREELDYLSKQQKKAELEKLEMIEKHRSEELIHCGNEHPVAVHKEIQEVQAEYDTITFWKERAMHLEKLLDASLQREQIAQDKLQERIQNLERQSPPVVELSQVLRRADNYLHFILQNAPVLMGHQDNELRYRFCYNHFPTSREEDIIGKTDVEIFSGGGVKESQDFKREVLERGVPAKREITFETELFGSKTFLIYVEPVFSKAGETIGVNYMGMDATDQVRKREKLAQLREEIAVQKARETELNKSIHITEEIMQKKQILATLSHEIRSPLADLISMSENLSTTKLDKEQRQLLSVILSSGDLVLKLISDILDLSKAELGVMRLEATKFNPRELVKNVLQTAAASLQKVITLEGHITEDVPVEANWFRGVLYIPKPVLATLMSNRIYINVPCTSDRPRSAHNSKSDIAFLLTEDYLSYILDYESVYYTERWRNVIGDVLQIRQILTILISNALKFTHEGKVGIKLYVIHDACACKQGDSAKITYKDEQTAPLEGIDQKYFDGKNHEEGPYQSHAHDDETKIPLQDGASANPEREEYPPNETAVWIGCDVYDTGIGIPEKALPTMFNKHMQAGADSAHKDGGTKFGLVTCKKLVELMGGQITASSRENKGSTLTFVLPYKVSAMCDSLDELGRNNPYDGR